MAESEKRQSRLFPFLLNQSTKESSKESIESSSSHENKKGKVLAKQDYEKKRKRNFQEHWKSEFPWLAAELPGELPVMKLKMLVFYLVNNIFSLVSSSQLMLSTIN